MWKAFIEARAPAAGRGRPAVLAVLLAAALQGGCAGTGPAAGGDGAAAGVAATAGTVPVPEVHGRNAEIFARATELLRAGRLVEAETLLLEITDDQPELAGPWINLAQIYLDQGREPDAVAALEQAVLANPANCAARTELGVLLRRRGEFADAEAHYLACLDHQPEHEAAYLNLGILYELYLGRLADALSAYRQYQALAAEPDRRVEFWVVDLERRLGS
jgi:tetratricopeptide (TPR) repeat protein